LSWVNIYAVWLIVMNGRQRNGTSAQIWGKWKTLIMMATVPHVSSGSGLRKFQADGFFVRQSVRVMLFSWLSVGRDNRQSTEKHNMYQFLYIHSIPPDDGLQICSKHIEVDWRNNASSWFLLHRCIEMHGQQYIKCRTVWGCFSCTVFARESLGYKSRDLLGEEKILD